jgi:hypothetical protein
MKPPRISLSVIAGFAPGIDWWSTIQLTFKDGDPIGRFEYDDGEIWIELSKNPDGLPLWRRFATTLATMEEMYRVPSQCLDDISLKGLSGWKADFLSLCWCKDEEQNGVSLGVNLLSLSDDTLVNDLVNVFRTVQLSGFFHIDQLLFLKIVGADISQS